MLAEGTYHGLIVGGSVVKHRTGKNQFVITVKVTHQANDTGGWDDVGPTERDMYWWMTEASRKYTDAKLDAIGFDGNFESPSFSTDAMTKGVQVHCRHEEYQGKVTDKWDMDGGAAGEPPPREELQRLAAEWRAKHPAKPKAQSLPPSATPTAAIPARPTFASIPSAVPTARKTVATPPAAGSAAAAKDAVWKDFVDSYQGGKPDHALWNQAVLAIGKAETDFTFDDWQQVSANLCPI